MIRGLYVDKPQSIIIKEAPEPALGPDQVRIRTEFASIKHGTDFHLFSGQSPFQKNHFDPQRQLFVPRATDDPGPSVGHFIGNTAVGTVTETGPAVTRFRPGDRVYCYAPACDRLTKAEREIHPLLPPLNEADAVCLDPAMPAYGAVRDARVCLGDTVVVFGLGAIGLLVVQMLRLGGCLNIVAVDPFEKRRRLAQTFGADLVLDPASADVALAVREHLGQGADIAIEASGHYRALHAAMRAVRRCGRIVTLGYYKGQDTELELGKEWMHNRLEMISSLPAWGNPLREYPLWDEERLTRTLVELFRRGALTSEGILDPVVPFAAATEAFLAVYRDPSEAVKLEPVMHFASSSTAFYCR